ncbi:MAG TPA: hypothetical protein VIL25_05540 [Vicinamibacterales bacterium]
MPIDRTLTRTCRPIAALALTLVAAAGQQAFAQEPLRDVLSFLLTNQAVPTEDFARDAEAAAVTRDTISRLLLAELATLPIGSTSAGFTYRFNPALGTVERASDSFGPFFAERSATAGAGQATVGVSVQFASYTHLNDVELDEGTLLTTANQFRDEDEPFDVERLALEIRSRTFTLYGNVGLTDRVDIGAVVPLVSLTLSGSRVNTYRGQQLLQASATAETTGLGDIAVRGKIRLTGGLASGVSLLGEMRLPTGREEDLLGAGEASFTATLVGSYEPGRVAAHVNAGFTQGGLFDELAYRGAISVSASPRVTIVGELSGRRIADIGRLTEERAPHPTIRNVDTIRLVTTGGALTSTSVTGGVRWNVGGPWLLNASVTIPIVNHGLRPRATTLVGLDYTFSN